MAANPHRYPIIWPKEHQRTYSQEVEVGGEFNLEPADVLILKAFSYGLDIRETAVVTGFDYHSIRDRSIVIQRELKAKNQPHAVANAMRLGIIS